MEDTSWFGPVSRIVIVEQSDGLLVRIVKIRRKGHLAVVLLVAVIASVYFAWLGSWLGNLVVLVIAVILVWAWFSDRRGEIHVTENYLTAYDKKQVRLAWPEIHGLQFSTGGEDDPVGLYARLGGWRSICVMANLNREQSEEIIAAIHHRFPNLKMAEEIEPLSVRLRSMFERWSGSKKGQT